MTIDDRLAQFKKFKEQHDFDMSVEDFAEFLTEQDRLMAAGKIHFVLLITLKRNGKEHEVYFETEQDAMRFIGHMPSSKIEWRLEPLH